MRRLKETEKRIEALEQELEDKKEELKELRIKNSSLETIKESEHLLKTLKPVVEPLIKDWKKYNKLEGGSNVQKNFESFVKMCESDYNFCKNNLNYYKKELKFFSRNIANYILLKKELRKFKEEIK